MKLIKKGAEADIYQTKWQNSNAILKIRKIKNYPIVSKKDKAILYDWLWKHMGRSRRWWQPDCVKLKY